MDTLSRITTLSFLVTCIFVGLEAFNFTAFNPFMHLQGLNGGLVFDPITVPTLPPKVPRCSDDYQCGKKETCNEYTKSCEMCKLRGEICRRSGNCCNQNLHCIWGKCIDPLKTDGFKNHKCFNHRDCATGYCCARYQGVSVCRPLVQEGESCEVPKGGYSFSINHKCPCEEGLHCQSVHPRRANDLRCVKPN